MFFLISKFTTFVLDPTFLILLFCLVCMVKKRKRIRFYWASVVLFLSFYLISTNFVSHAALNWLEDLKPSSPLQKRYDAVIVLSGMTRLSISTLDQVEFSEAVERILTGIELVRSDRADYMILSGGSGDPYPPPKKI